METVIGLGQAGCNIAEKFLQYPQYVVYRIDTESRKGPKFKKIPACQTHEEYEQKCPSFKHFLKDAKPPYLFIVGGSGTISGLSLRLLEQLKTNDVYILYVKPDVALLSDRKQKQDRVTFGVLQQFARSNLLKRIYVIDNTKLENILSDIPVLEYYDRLNTLVASTVHMFNIFQNTQPIIGTFSEPIETARISTFGLVDYKTGEESLFYDLTIPREKVYYYSIEKNKLESEGNLVQRIKNQVKEKLEDKLKVSYGIYSNDYDQNYVYVLVHATLIQDLDIDSL